MTNHDNRQMTKYLPFIVKVKLVKKVLQIRTPQTIPELATATGMSICQVKSVLFNTVNGFEDPSFERVGTWPVDNRRYVWRIADYSRNALT